MYLPFEIHSDYAMHALEDLCFIKDGILRVFRPKNSLSLLKRSQDTFKIECKNLDQNLMQTSRVRKIHFEFIYLCPKLK